jgi:hypothetical protein
MGGHFIRQSALNLPFRPAFSIVELLFEKDFGQRSAKEGAQEEHSHDGGGNLKKLLLIIDPPTAFTKI